MLLFTWFKDSVVIWFRLCLSLCLIHVLYLYVLFVDRDCLCVLIFVTVILIALEWGKIQKPWEFMHALLGNFEKKIPLMQDANLTTVLFIVW